MLRTSITALLAVLGAAVFAFSRGLGGDVGSDVGGDVGGEATGWLDRVGAGVLFGALAAAAVALLSHSLVRFALQTDTVAAFRALTLGFGAKFLAAILPWAVLTYLPQAQGIADPIAYLLTYASCVLVILGVGVLENLRLSNDVALDSRIETGIDPRAEARERSADFQSSSASGAAHVGPVSDSRGLGPLESAS